jgi:chaperonin GroEL
VPGGRTCFAQSRSKLDETINGLKGSIRQGAELLQRALSRPLFYIAANAGLNGEAEVTKFAKGMNGHGLDARNGASVDLVKAGIIDPVKVCCSAVRNAASVAGLILTTDVDAKSRRLRSTAGRPPGGGAGLCDFAANTLEGLVPGGHLGFCQVPIDSIS